jgi:hypothetical protein
MSTFWKDIGLVDAAQMVDDHVALARRTGCKIGASCGGAQHRQAPADHAAVD